MTIRDALTVGIRRLRGISTTPDVDSEMLISLTLGRDTGAHDVFVLTHPEHVLTSVQEERFFAALTQREKGLPIAYITHTKEFYGRDFFVDPRVLVPRPETELIIDAIKTYALTRDEGGEQKPLHVLDIGTGSGCIGITLALELPGTSVTATDISADALDVAQKNAATLGATITFARGDLFGALSNNAHHSFECIVSNPPYVDLRTVDSTAAVSNALQYEPLQALTPGADTPSHATIEQIIQNAVPFLKPHGLLCIEIGYDQGDITRTIASEYFPDATIAIQKDLAGFDRLLTVQLL